MGSDLICHNSLSESEVSFDGLQSGEISIRFFLSMFVSSWNIVLTSSFYKAFVTLFFYGDGFSISSKDYDTVNSFYRNSVKCPASEFNVFLFSEANLTCIISGGLISVKGITSGICSTSRSVAQVFFLSNKSFAF